MKTYTFKTTEMYDELKKVLNEMKDDDERRASLEGKMKALEEYKDLTITVRKLSANQKDSLEQIILGSSLKFKGNRLVPEATGMNLGEFRKKSVQFGIVDIQPRIAEMEQVSEGIWQIKDEILSDMDWDLRDILLELVDQVNQKNWI